MKSEAVKKAADDLRKVRKPEKSPVISGLFSICENNTKNTSRDIISERIRDSGLINRIGLLFGLDIKLGLMYHASGIIVMNMWFNIPFATMMIAAGLGAIPDSIIEASRDSGAGRWKTFTSMILPLSMKDVVVASTFVFMSNVGSFTTPYLMGGNSPKMLGIALYDQFNKYLSYNRSAALSVIMFLICSVSAAVYIYTNLKEKDWEK